MSAALFEELLRRYAEPHRHHHDTRHLAEVMDVVDELAGQADDVEVVRLAAWFHDAVYEPRRADNEERSAALAEQVLPRLGMPDAQTREVARLVRLTTRHDPAPGDRNGALLCDADLAVLASPETRYREYAAAVRAEHAELDDPDFASGRAEVLRDLLARDTLFHTEPGRARWEAKARLNVHRELTELTGVGRASSPS